MSKLLVIFGITGQQGAAVASRILSSPALSSQFKLRGITRDPASSSAQEWSKKGVELVKADLDDEASLKHALNGAHTVFGMTNSSYDLTKKHLEVAQGKRLADAALAASAQHLIWSTTPSAEDVSGGKLKHVAHFDAKADVVKYIRTLSMRSSFFAPGPFMQNFTNYFRAHPDGQGGFVVANFVKPETKLPLIDIVNDTGKYIAAMLQSPEKYDGKYILAAGGVYSFQETAEVMSRISGRKVSYKQIPEEAWRKYLPAHMAQEFVEMMLLFQDYGYHGPETEEMVREGRQGVEGVTTFEDFVKENLPALGLA